MSRMLNFYDAAWASARACALAGRRADALGHLAPLVASPDAPDRLKLLAHRLAARLHAAAQRYGKARRHLYEAAKLDPGNAEVHYEIGAAFESDPYGCDRRAARRFKKAAALAPTPRHRAALGRALVRINRVRPGVAHLQAAADAAPSDVAVLRVVIDGLCDAGRAGLAGKVAARAKFLAPASAEVGRLWDEVRFAEARQDQCRGRQVVGAGPVVLPFLRVAGAAVRRDGGSRTGPHLGRLRAYRAGQG